MNTVGCAHFYPGLIRLSNNMFTLMCLALIRLKSLWRHWLGASKTMTWLHTGEQRKKKKTVMQLTMVLLSL